jgi:hypothetical protein
MARLEICLADLIEAVQDSSEDDHQTLAALVDLLLRDQADSLPCGLRPL